MPFDLGGQCGPSTGEQHHRLVTNGIWEMPGGLQLSGLYFFGSGQRSGTQAGRDGRDSGGKSNRLRTDGTIVERNNWVGLPIHRVDMKLAWPIPAGAYEIEASVEIFNLFNHANFYTYVTNEASPSYGNPASVVPGRLRAADGGRRPEGELLAGHGSAGRPGEGTPLRTPAVPSRKRLADTDTRQQGGFMRRALALGSHRVTQLHAGGPGRRTAARLRHPRGKRA